MGTEGAVNPTVNAHSHSVPLVTASSGLLLVMHCLLFMHHVLNVHGAPPSQLPAWQLPLPALPVG